MHRIFTLEVVCDIFARSTIRYSITVFSRKSLELSTMFGHLARLASFASWPSTSTVSSLALARAGFKYTGEGESTVCVECHLVIDSWQSGDRPDQVHSQQSPNCPFVRSQLEAGDSSVLRTSAVEHSSHNTDGTSIVHGLTTSDSVTRQVNSVSDLSSSTASQSPLSCTINRDHPDFVLLKNESVRMSTFYDWPERVTRIVEPRDLAKAGLFYTGQCDRVQCAFCRGYLRNWVQGDSPAEEHRRHFPDCSLSQQQKDVHDGRIAMLTANHVVDVSVITDKTYIFVLFVCLFILVEILPPRCNMSHLWGEKP